MKKVFLAVLSVLFTAGLAAAADETSWLDIGGDYQFRFDSLRGRVHEYYNFNDVLPWQLGGMTTPPPATVKGYDVKNDSLMTNRFGLNLKASSLENVTVKARLIMYKVWGHESSTPVNGSFFADRATGPNDGTVGHIPQDNTLRVDYAYATWSNIGDMPIWFSVGRRPTTGGIPTNLREDIDKVGTAGVPGILVDYAFDGATVGYAPDIAALPGAFVKLCYGKGFDSGYVPTSGSTLQDTEFYGVMAALYDTENLRAELQYQKGSNIFDAPSDGSALTGPVRHNLGDIDWIGGVVMGKVDDLNLFVSAAQSQTHPNDQMFEVNASPTGPLVPVAGLLYDAGNPAESRTGAAVYVGGRYDIDSTGTKIGAEYNQGSKYWVGMVPASDDIWTAKLGTRGSVYEIYIIQELKNNPISRKGKAFFKVGFQSYRFDYTGSNGWVGAPKKISDLANTPANAQMLAPIERATDIYTTFEVRF